MIYDDRARSECRYCGLWMSRQCDPKHFGGFEKCEGENVENR